MGGGVPAQGVHEKWGSWFSGQSERQRPGPQKLWAKTTAEQVGGAHKRKADASSPAGCRPNRSRGPGQATAVTATQNRTWGDYGVGQSPTTAGSALGNGSETTAASGHGPRGVTRETPSRRMGRGGSASSGCYWTPGPAEPRPPQTLHVHEPSLAGLGLHKHGPASTPDLHEPGPG